MGRGTSGTLMRVLITGGAGTVGSALVHSAPPGVEVAVTVFERPAPAAVAAHRVDLREPGAVASLVQRLTPDVVIHTAYRQAERAAIVDATAEVAGACAAQGCALVHLSTDVVFDGAHPPYDEASPTAPVSDYGRWKLEAERIVTAAVPDATITRTSLVVGLDPPDRATGALLAAVRAGERPRLFVDEWRQPIAVDDLAVTLWALVVREDRAGLWHLPGPERLHRMEIARRVLARAGLGDAPLTAASVHDHPEPRPADLTMTSSRPGLVTGLPGPFDA